jgi:GDP-L-fucose synthase
MAGRAVVARLRAVQPKCKIRANYFNQKEPFQNDSEIEQMRGDLRKLEDARALCRDCDAVVMVAAATGGAAQNVNEPWRQVNDNLIMNALLLEAAHLEKVKRVILVGSASCYQDREGVIRESDLNLEQDPPSAYFGIGWVTRSVEKLAQFWHVKAGLNVICMRSANIYGPYAKFDPAVSNFIPALVRKAADGMDPFEVWGSPDMTRDVIFSEDFADACIRLLMAEEILHDVFNVSIGVPVRVDEVVKEAVVAAGYEPEIVYNQSKPVTVRSRVLDSSKLQKVVGWTPTTTLRDGIAQTLAWWKKNRNTWTR